VHFFGFESLTLEVSQERVKDCELPGSGIRVGLISTGKVSEDSVHLDRGVFEPFEERRDKCRVHSKATHARFNFKVGMQRAAVDVDIIKVISRQLRVEECHRDVVLNCFGYLGCGGETQHQYFAGDASAAQGKRFFDARHANPGGAASNSSLSGRASAMTIAIGLDHSHNFHSGPLANQSDVVLDGLEIDLKPG